jgi:hypothetical protein
MAVSAACSGDAVDGDEGKLHGLRGGRAPHDRGGRATAGVSGGCSGALAPLQRWCVRGEGGDVARGATVEAGLWPLSHRSRSKLEEHNRGVASGGGAQWAKLRSFARSCGVNPPWKSHVPAQQK